MSFSWISVIKNETLVSATHVNEAQDNIQTVLTAIGKTFSWTADPLIISGDFVKYDEWKELRDAADFAEDWNYCWADNSTANGTVDATDYSTNNASKDNTYNSAVQTGLCPAYDVTYYYNVYYLSQCSATYTYCGSNLTAIYK